LITRDSSAVPFFCQRGSAQTALNEAAQAVFPSGPLLFLCVDTSMKCEGCGICQQSDYVAINGIYLY
jgi:hypothetical protein